MADEQPEGGSETGGSLRAKLEASLEANRQMAAELHGFKAQQIIAEKGYKHVTIDDLQGVDLTELATKAEAIEKQNLQLRETVLKETLQSQGLDGDRLDEAVKNLLHPQESHADTSTRLANLGRIAGGAPGAHDTENLTGRQLIMAGIEENEKSHKPR